MFNQLCIKDENTHFFSFSHLPALVKRRGFCLCNVANSNLGSRFIIRSISNSNGTRMVIVPIKIKHTKLFYLKSCLVAFRMELWKSSHFMCIFTLLLLSQFKICTLTMLLSQIKLCTLCCYVNLVCTLIAKSTQSV